MLARPEIVITMKNNKNELFLQYDIVLWIAWPEKICTAEQRSSLFPEHGENDSCKEFHKHQTS